MRLMPVTRRLAAVLVAAGLVLAGVGVASPAAAAAPKCNANACSSYPPILPGCVFKRGVYICPR